MTLCVLLHVGDKIPESGIWNYLPSSFSPWPVLPLPRTTPQVRLAGLEGRVLGAGSGLCGVSVSCQEATSSLAWGFPRWSISPCLTHDGWLCHGLILCGGFPRTFVLTFFYPLKNKWFCRDQFVLFRSAVANWWFRSQGEYVKGSAWWTPHAPQFWLLQLYKQVRRLCKLLHFLLHA